MKILVPAAMAASLVLSGAAFAADTSTGKPADNPAASSAAVKPKLIQHHHMAKMLSNKDQEESQRETKALNMIEAHGYGTISSFRADGNQYDATVTQNGKTVSLKIDPDHGRISRQG